MIKLAKAFIKKEEIDGKYGKFSTFNIYGENYNDTYSIKDQLRRLGFAWYGPKKCWYISANKMTETLKQELLKLGVSGIEGTTQNQTPIPTTEPEPKPKPIAEQTPKKKEWVTENEEMTKWYGFPINKNIYQFKAEIDIDGEKIVEDVIVGRSFIPGHSGKKVENIKVCPDIKLK